MDFDWKHMNVLKSNSIHSKKSNNFKSDILSLEACEFPDSPMIMSMETYLVFLRSSSVGDSHHSHLGQSTLLPHNILSRINTGYRVKLGIIDQHDMMTSQHSLLKVHPCNKKSIVYRTSL